ncbi:MAG: hypothetical protein BM555_03460 [Crocinitomix sp. MedPE-SWsnd]|nr:MAG: hypothetical protein BM555_03460 [Crocinitomix sp. MedPE-SWsnd]
MTIQTVLLLILIGLAAGTLSGFVGVGGGVIMVPALMYVMGMSQHMAQGTSLFLMLFPIGILAVMNYHKAGEINWTFGIIIACAFVFGGYFGSKLALRMSPHVVKLIFGILMLYVAGRMIYKGYNGYTVEKQTTSIAEE